VWFYKFGGWDAPKVFQQGDDEWGRITLAVALPFGAAMVVPYRWCRDNNCEACADKCPHDGKIHMGTVDGRPVCAWCDPALYRGLHEGGPEHYPAFREWDQNEVTKYADLAQEAHAGQTDKQGRDYFRYHLQLIAAQLIPYGMDYYLAGLLHDLLEDTDWTADRLRGVGCPSHVIAAVQSVTLHKGERYTDMIDRACRNPIGRKVKLKDNWWNLGQLENLRASGGSDELVERLRVKYTKALIKLLDAEYADG